ncbi:MAG: hypothetical protein M1818_003544 [Claussenomyces sp. TS43310]|nr:MAG: hypothetical protein M1818_003544 [Claussenomyces sp. TS43310]
MTSAPISPTTLRKGCPHRESSPTDPSSKSGAAQVTPSLGPGPGRNNAATLREERSVAQRNEREARAGSVSGTSGPASSTAMSGDTLPGHASAKSPFIMRHGRRHFRDPSLSYPLPCDLQELHRQILETMFLTQVLGGPICSPSYRDTPPKNILHLGCGTGYWSSICHKHYASRGHSISFTGLDLVEFTPGLDKVDGMQWRFVQHNLQDSPLPFEDAEFDFVLISGGSSIATHDTAIRMLEEYIRVLRPGGTVEVWETDKTFRMLLPNTNICAPQDDGESEDEEHDRARITGTYLMTPSISFAPPQNQYLSDFNVWISEALGKRSLGLTPCAEVRPFFLSRDEDLIEIGTRRVAIPLGEIRWEREGIGSSVTQDGSARSNQNSSSKSKAADSDRKVLSTAQAALRRTALLTVVQRIEALEPLLKEASGKGQDEWDRWLGNMMKDLLIQNGTSCGECLESGVWWATKKSDAKPRKASQPAEISRIVPAYGANPPQSPSFRAPEKFKASSSGLPVTFHGFGGIM